MPHLDTTGNNTAWRRIVNVLFKLGDVQWLENYFTWETEKVSDCILTTPGHALAPSPSQAPHKKPQSGPPPPPSTLS